MLLSACYITKNAETFLEQSIESVYKYVDEIIVVDFESIDKTMAIIKSFPQKKFKIVSKSFGDGSDTKENLKRIKTEQRNMYLKMSKAKWILVVDSDEVYMNRDILWLQEFLASADEMCVRYPSIQFWKDFKQIITGPHWDNSQERCFRNQPNLNYDKFHFSVSIGNEVLAKKYGKDYENKIYWCNNNQIAIYHYGMCMSEEKIREKIRTYMWRDNPNVNEENLEKFVSLHPYFSNNFDQSRHGKKGLWIAGSNKADKKERVFSFHGKHPESMQKLVEERSGL